MTNREQAKMSMYGALNLVLTEYNTVYNNKPRYVRTVLDFKIAYANNFQAAASANPNNSGFSSLKGATKLELSDVAANLSGKAYVHFNDLEKASIAEQLHVYPTNYSQVADSLCGALAQGAHDLLFTHLNVLNPDTITPTMLIDFQNLINTFRSQQGNSSMLHELSPLLTKEYKDSFKVVDKKIFNLKLLTRDFEKINLEFFNKVKASTIIPPINVHHTFVEIIAVAKSTGNVVENVFFSLAKGLKKSGTTNEEGKTLLSKVRFGKDVLTVKIEGNEVQTNHIHIKRGVTNHYTIIIEGM